jgi:hypothetical protein
VAAIVLQLVGEGRSRLDGAVRRIVQNRVWAPRELYPGVSGAVEVE